MMRFTTPWLFLAVLSSILLAGCSGETARKDNEASTRRYEIKGKVVSVDPQKPAIMLDHEDIPGLMKAMEMEFAVEDAKILDGIKPGDQVKGELVKEKSRYLITRLEKR
jgi:Cu/Ag efflux protein CusF